VGTVTKILAIVPILVALVSSTLTLVVRSWPRLQQATSILGAVAYTAAVGILVWSVVFADGAGAVAYNVGGTTTPFGIILVADALSALMLSMTAIVTLYSITFSVSFIREANQRVYYHPLFHFLLLGVTGAFLTGDLFNLFVWFEVMLMASYVFVSFYGSDTHTAAAMRYVVLNIVGSTLMLLAIGGLYATVGTLNMADMAQRLADPAASVSTAPVVGLSALLFTTFALKAGLVPFQFWVPSAYRAAPMPVAATLAGATKKVGIYAIIRIYFTIFGSAAVTTNVPGIAVESPLAFLAPILLIMGIFSILVGGLGAVSQETVDGLLAYSSIGQVGFIAVPVAVAAATTSETLRHLGVLAGLIYAFHHALTKGLLFLSAAAIRDATGTTQLSKLGGLGQESSVFASVFFVGGLSLVGIPPLAGFFGKFFIFDAAATRFADTSGIGAALVMFVLFLGAVLTIIYSTRAWVRSFWGSQTPTVEAGALEQPQVFLLATLAAIVVLVGVGFDPVYRFADAAAEAAIDTDQYIDVVLGGDSA